MNFRDWVAWNWDGPTAFWAFWIVAFFIGELLTSGVSPIQAWRENMLTDHLRPVFLAAPLTWFTVFGLWLWIGVHLLAPTLEEGLLRMVSELGSR